MIEIKLTMSSEYTTIMPELFFNFKNMPKDREGGGKPPDNEKGKVIYLADIIKAKGKTSEDQVDDEEEEDEEKNLKKCSEYLQNAEENIHKMVTTGWLEPGEDFPGSIIMLDLTAAALYMPELDSLALTLLKLQNQYKTKWAKMHKTMPEYEDEETKMRIADIRFAQKIKLELKQTAQIIHQTLSKRPKPTQDK